ncbi:MAG: hypothetical protein ABR549_08730 [Mycobacteriales bacterium]
MLSMLLSLVVVVLAVLVAAALGVGFTAAPFVRTVDMAERRGFSPARWGGAQLVLTGLAVPVGYVAVKHTLALAGPALLLCWLAPGVLSLLSDQETSIGGRQGAHEP